MAAEERDWSSASLPRALSDTDEVVHRDVILEVKNTNIDNDYLDLCRRILSDGKLRHNRTGVDAYSRFGERLDIDLKKGFPLLTTKRVFWNGVVRELLWFLSGSTDTTVLSRAGVHIWDGNTTRAALDARGLKEYQVGEAGPIYGWQWRNFGADYTGFSSREGVDQIKDLIRQIKKDPFSRRLIVSAWNPVDLNKMALPPCHIMYQFYVDDGELSCQMYQRSVDVGLGLPFNIASYALLTHLVAHVTGLRVGRLVMCLGDTHIYTTHREGILEQMTREPRALPRLEIKVPCGAGSGSSNIEIDKIQLRDIVLLQYSPHPPLTHEMPMAV